MSSRSDYFSHVFLGLDLFDYVEIFIDIYIEFIKDTGDIMFDVGGIDYCFCTQQIVCTFTLSHIEAGNYAYKKFVSIVQASHCKIH